MESEDGTVPGAGQRHDLGAIGRSSPPSVLALTPLLAGAQQPGPASPTVDLALSGGSAKGIAHIGVLRTLERLGVHVDVVAATSMGAVVGGLYALGLSVDSIESVIAGAEWSARSWGPTSCASWST